MYFMKHNFIEDVKCRAIGGTCGEEWCGDFGATYFSGEGLCLDEGDDLCCVKSKFIHTMCGHKYFYFVSDKVCIPTLVKQNNI